MNKYDIFEKRLRIFDIENWFSRYFTSEKLIDVEFYQKRNLIKCSNCHVNFHKVVLINYKSYHNFDCSLIEEIKFEIELTKLQSHIQAKAKILTIELFKQKKFNWLNKKFKNKHNVKSNWLNVKSNEKRKNELNWSNKLNKKFNYLNQRLKISIVSILHYYAIFWNSIYTAKWWIFCKIFNKFNINIWNQTCSIYCSNVFEILHSHDSKINQILSSYKISTKI